MKFLRYFLEAIIEILIILLHPPCYVLFKYVSLRPKKSQVKKLPEIVIVERWFRKNIFHVFAKYYLEKNGFKVYDANFLLKDGSFESSGTQLSDYIESRKIKTAVLIGISAGALTCFEYLQNKNGWNRVSLFISIAGPFNGSWLAKIAPFNNSIKEMMPGSLYLKGLFQKPIINLDKIYSIRAKADNMVPVKSSYIEGAHNITIDVVGHNLLHGFWIPTYKKVVSIINSAN